MDPILTIATIAVTLSLQDARVPPPGPDQIKAAESLIRAIFKAEYARPDAAERKALAKRLLQDGRDTKEDPATKFVLYRESHELAAQSGDLQTALAAVDEMSRIFAVDSSALKLGVLSTASKAARLPEELKALGEAFAAVAEEALQAGDPDAAQKAAGASVQAARRAKDLPLLNRAEAAVRTVADAKAAQTRVRKALEKLESSPDDPEANLACGRYYCFTLKNWEKGLGCLAKGSDTGLKTLAETELAGASTDGILKLADGWWDAAEKDAAIRAAGRERAVYWYTKGWSQTQGLTREKARTRLRTAAGVPPASKPVGRAVGWNLTATSTLEAGFAKSGKQSVRVAAPPGNNLYGAVDTSRFKVAPGQQYVLSAWVFADGNSGPRDDLFLRLWAPGGAFKGQPGPAVPLDQPYWTRILQTIIIPEGIAEIDVSLQMRSKAGVIWIDDVSLTLDGRELLPNGSFEQ